MPGASIRRLALHERHRISGKFEFHFVLLMQIGKHAWEDPANIVKSDVSSY